MKRSLWIAAFGTAFFGGCCTKEDCDGLEGIDYIELEGYTWSEADTVQVVRFAQNTGLSQALDTILQPTPFEGNNIDTSGPQFSIFLPLPASADYLISFPGAGRSHTISGMVFGQRECNVCFLRQDYYTTLTSVAVDGQLVQPHDVVLRR